MFEYVKPGFEKGFGVGVLSADKMVAKCIWKEHTVQCALLPFKKGWISGLPFQSNFS